MKKKMGDLRLEGTLLNNKYRVERRIAKGGMSTVYLCTNIELGNKWIAKHIDRKYANNIYEEEILKRLYHISLPKIADVCRDASGVFIIESYVEGISLMKLITNMCCPEIDKSIDYMIQLCEVLLYLHNMKPKAIIHKDLKPSNIIITEDGKLVLIDFGIAEEQGSIAGGIKAATNAYASPEQLAAEGVCDTRGDIYSFGVVLMQLVEGAHYKGASGTWTYRSFSIEKMLLDIVKRCTAFYPEDRYQRVEEIRQDLIDTRDRMIAAKESKKVIRRLALSAVVVLSLIDYIAALIGIIIF